MENERINELLKISRKMALEIIACPKLDDAAMKLALLLVRVSDEQVELHKRRVLALLGIPEGVPCSGE